MGKAPADWSNDDETVKKERKGYALSGWATGPDTVMSALWSAGLFYSAGLDATCWTSADGYPSGADGAACVAHGNWNQSLFNSVGGHAACSSSDLLGAHLYVHDSKSADCASAFAAYRAAPEYTGGVMYTCNCSGNKNSHAFLGDGGLRPDLTYTTMLTVAGFVLAALFIPMGTASDFLSNRLFVWKMLTHVCFVTTLGMAVVFQGIWIIGLIMCGLTVLSSEIVIPLRASYIRFAAPGGDEATVGYLGGMRQAWSFAAQLLFAILLGGLAFSGVVDAALQSTIMAVLAGVWFEIFMLRVFNNFTEHGALRTREGGMGSLVCFSYTDFAKTLVKICTEIPEAGKVLFVSAMMNVGGGGTLIAISSTFAVVFLDMGALYPLVTISALLVGFPMSLLFAHLRKNDTVSFKMLWLIVGILFLLINVLVPIVRARPHMHAAPTRQRAISRMLACMHAYLLPPCCLFSCVCNLPPCTPMRHLRSPTLHAHARVELRSASSLR